MTITVIDKRHSSVDVQADRLLAKIDKRKLARQRKNFVVLTLRKLRSLRGVHGQVLGAKKDARNLYDIMKSNERTGKVNSGRFFGENNALNTPKYYPRNPKARRAVHRYCAGLVQMAIDADNR